MEINIFYSGIKYIIDKITTFFPSLHMKRKKDKKKGEPSGCGSFIYGHGSLFSFLAPKAFKYKANIKITRSKKNSQL